MNFLRQPFIRKALCNQAFANPQKSVSPAEEQIASIHLDVPGWGRSLAAFAQNGGVANCGIPIPKQAMQILIGEGLRIYMIHESFRLYHLWLSTVILGLGIISIQRIRIKK